jgi:hypothetical protein
MKKPDILKEFVQLQASLRKEKSEIEGRLKELDRALGDNHVQMPVAAREPTSPRVGKRREGGRRENSISLREAVIQVTSKRALTKPEIIDAVTKLGYRFNSKDPINYLGTVLYGKKPKFKKDNGRFSLSHRG